jgi:hypothetical protein
MSPAAWPVPIGARPDVEAGEEIKRIEAAIPVGLRGAYLQLLGGQSVSKTDGEVVRAIVAEVVGAIPAH